MPEPMLPPMFIPRPRPAVQSMQLQELLEDPIEDEEDFSEGPSRIPYADKGKGRAADEPGNGISIDGNTVYLEDLLGPRQYC